MHSSHTKSPETRNPSSGATTPRSGDFRLDDFSMLIPDGLIDSSGIFLEDNVDDFLSEDSSDNKTGSVGTLATTTTVMTTTTTTMTSAAAAASRPIKQAKVASRRLSAGSNKRGSAASASGADEDDDEDEDDEKKKKRRQQIAVASRASRARRKRELEDLRDENNRLREERSQFLSKIGELQMKVENMRERGSTDMRVENELLRAQLEEHKRFVGCFKRLCDGAPSSLNARHLIYKQGADSAQAHVLALISQSQAEEWVEAIVPPNANIPYQNFSMFYKFKTDYGEGEVAKMTPAGEEKKPRERLNVRVDVLFPGLDSSQVAEFFWNSFSDTTVQQRLYRVKGIELTQLADDMPDRDTKMVYYRETADGANKKAQDLVMICNRRRRELAKSTLSLPQKTRGTLIVPDLGKVAAQVLVMSTTQHSVAPQFDNATRITSMFVQGAIVWNVGSDARLSVVFSIPDDFTIKAVNSITDIVDRKGQVTEKFAEVLRSFREMLGEGQEGLL